MKANLKVRMSLNTIYGEGKDEITIKSNTLTSIKELLIQLKLIEDVIN